MIRKICVLLIVCSLIVSSNALSQQSKEPLRIGYFESGSNFLHKIIYREISSSLELIKPADLEIYFEPYAYKTAGWDREKCKLMAREYTRMKDIDIVLAAGPWVIEDLIEAGFEGAIVGIYQFDPQVTGLLDLNGIPIAANLTVNYAPNKIKSDLSMMERLFPSERIGFLYFPSGNEFTKMYDKILKASEEFENEVYGANEYSNNGNYSFFKSFEKLNHKIDVLYLPPLWGMELDQINQLLLEVTRARIPTFSSDGFVILEKGATAGNSVYSHRPTARIIANKVLQIHDGAKPSSLPTIFEEVPSLCLNLESAHKLDLTFKRTQINNAKTIPAIAESWVPRYNLTTALEQAVRENSGLLMSDEQYNMAMADVQKAYSSFYPDLDLNLMATAADATAEAAAYNQIYNREFAAEVVLNHDLFSIPAIKAIQIAKKKSEIDKNNRRQTELDLQNAVISAYIAVIALEERLEADEDKIDRLRDFWSMAVVNQKIGLTDSLDIFILEERLIAAKIKSHQLRNELRLAQIILNVLINRPGDDLVILDRDEFTTEKMVFLARKYENYASDSKRIKKMEEYLLDVGINNSIDMETANLSIGIQKDLISRHKNRYIPKLSLRAKYSYGQEFEPSVDDRDGNWFIGGMLTVPIFSGSETLYEGKKLNNELNSLRYRKDLTRFRKYQEILTMVNHFILLSGTLPMNYFTNNLAEGNVDKVFDKYIKDSISVLDLINLAEKSFAAKENLIQTRYNFFDTYAGMLYTMGMEYPMHGSGNQKKFMEDLESYMESNPDQ